MFPSYRVLSSQTTTIAECQWLFNCYLLFGGVESPTQATDDSEKIVKRNKKRNLKKESERII